MERTGRTGRRLARDDVVNIGERVRCPKACETRSPPRPCPLESQRPRCPRPIGSRGTGPGEDQSVRPRAPGGGCRRRPCRGGEPPALAPTRTTLPAPPRREGAPPSTPTPGPPSTRPRRPPGMDAKRKRRSTARIRQISNMLGHTPGVSPDTMNGPGDGLWNPVAIRADTQQGV